MTKASQTFVGFGPTLSNAEDLLIKLKFDFGRIKSDPCDVYAAFDFCVTAEHLPEWCGQKSVKNTEPILRVVSHLANGAKHFIANDPKHKSVADVGLRNGIFNSAIFDPEMFNTGGIFVALKGEDAVALGSEISSLELARQVLTFWEQRLGG